MKLCAGGAKQGMTQDAHTVVQYGCEPVSWFQKKIRGNMMVLNDHISKEMNDLNLIRCQHIPKRPVCDRHDLPDEKVKLTNGQMADLIPWCLPNTTRGTISGKGCTGGWTGNAAFPHLSQIPSQWARLACASTVTITVSSRSGNALSLRSILQM